MGVWYEDAECSQGSMAFSNNGFTFNFKVWDAVQDNGK